MNTLSHPPLTCIVIAATGSHRWTDLKTLGGYLKRINTLAPSDGDISEIHVFHPKSSLAAAKYLGLFSTKYRVWHHGLGMKQLAERFYNLEKRIFCQNGHFYS